MALHGRDQRRSWRRGEEDVAGGEEGWGRLGALIVVVTGPQVYALTRSVLLLWENKEANGKSLQKFLKLRAVRMMERDASRLSRLRVI
jgi:hypothetical protein